ncbi:sugar-binding transcriptional regulator [Actinomyces wuliandei]|uniref:sugar-binding transcriptional regulator n=1 Tax=Actinomyces wuliandei TaxID=2057743 RepID=UPI000FD6E594|nr:sugar-binding domain-containing protein [Actinomyces wuliandei]
MCAAGVDRNRIRLLLEVSRMYWEEGVDQEEVARRTGYSRSTVSRLLAQARRTGVVTVRVSHPVERLTEIEDRLVSAYGLRAVRVTEQAGDQLGAQAAELLLEHCRPTSVIAVSNGREVGSVVRSLPQRSWPRSLVVQMLGLVGQSSGLEDGPDICRDMAMRLGGSHQALPVPLVFDTVQAADAMRREEQVVITLELAARSDVALTGVGAVERGAVSPILRRWMTPELLEQCARAGAVAHICGHHIDARGAHVPTPLCRRTVCLEPDRLREVPLVIGVAHGWHKVEAIRAVLRGGYLSGLVTDEATAAAVLGDR